MLAMPFHKGCTSRNIHGQQGTYSLEPSRMTAFDFSTYQNCVLECPLPDRDRLMKAIQAAANVLWGC